MHKKTTALIATMLLFANITFATPSEQPQNSLSVISGGESPQNVNVDVSSADIQTQTDETSRISDIIATAIQSGMCESVKNLDSAYACLYNVAIQDASITDNELSIIKEASQGSREAQALLSTGDSDIYAMYADDSDLEELAYLSEEAIQKYLESETGKAFMSGGGAMIGTIIKTDQGLANTSVAKELEALKLLEIENGLSMAEISLNSYQETLNRRFVSGMSAERVNNGINFYKSMINNYTAKLPNSSNFGQFTEPIYNSMSNFSKMTTPATKETLTMAQEKLNGLKSQLNNAKNGLEVAKSAFQQNGGTLRVATVTIENNTENIKNVASTTGVLGGIAETLGVSMTTATLATGFIAGCAAVGTAWAGIEAYNSWSNSKEEFYADQMESIKYGDDPNNGRDPNESDYMDMID